MKHTKSVGSKVFIFLLLVVVVAVVFFVVRSHRTSSSVPEQIVLPEQHGFVPVPTPEPSTLEPIPTPTPSGIIPTQYSLAVPFTPQAPTGNWDELHNEACEEASSIMANAFFAGEKRSTLPPADVEKSISNLTDWQDAHFGYHLDTTADETAQMIEGVYGLHARLISNFTEATIKKEIAAGHVVILPVNGQQIGNPYYKQPGPIYHMLVVRGYTADKLITNDSGTKRGQDYSYSFATLQKAAADWDHATNTIDQTKKVMIVVSK